MNRIAVDALARVLDDDLTFDGAVSEELCALGELALALKARALEPRPEFKADLRARLLAAAEQSAAVVPGLTRLRERVNEATARWRYSSRVAAATGATALALSGGGVSVAAERSLPSDVLYPAKLVLEDVRIALVRDGVSRGAAHLAQVATRLDEAAVVAGDGDQAGAARALREADEAARSGARELIRAYQAERNMDTVHRLTAFVSEQRGHLASFDGLLAGEAVEAARVLFVGLERIEARALAVSGRCPTCAGGVPGPGVGFDFAEIPPADHPFMACPCEFRSSGDGPSRVDQPQREAPSDPPARAEEPPAPLDEVGPDDLPPAEPALPVDPPEPVGDVVPSEPPPGLPALRETTDGLLNGLLRELLDETTDTVDDTTQPVDGLLDE